VPTVLRKLIQKHPYQLKFVIAQPSDLGEIRQILAEIHADSNHVVLMPEGIDEAVLCERSRWIADLCKEHGYRFTPRLHVQIWGNRRGT
jgi:7-carboxy-7-deazaguanine synthase